MRKVTAAAIAIGVLLLQSPAQSADAPRVAQAPAEKSAPVEKMPGKGAGSGVKIRGTVEAVDKDKGAVTLKGPGGRTLTLQVKDKAKLDAIQVGDPVVATYVEAVAFQVKKAGTAAPGMSAQESRVTSKPGETPAGAIGREITVTATITAIDKKAHTVTIKGPEGNVETIKAKNPKNLDAVKVGDLVEITYIQALVIALDKSAKK
jgi:Cu/Ag efflux protein CusF